jgi:dihydroorotate dehydrogenase (NAD+) catalytic subunit
MIAGATAVAVGTANFINPMATMEILDGMIEYMKIHQIEDIGSLTGTVDAP